MNQKRFLRRPGVLAATGLSATSIYNLEKRGDFPRHFMLTPRCAAWDAAEVEAWMSARKACPAKAAAGPDQTLRTCRPGKGTKRQQVVA